MTNQTLTAQRFQPFGEGRLVVLGAGESGVGAALLAQQQGWRVLVSDGNAVKPAFAAELTAAGIAYEENGHQEAAIFSADCVVKSPGIPENAPLVMALREAGMVLMGEIEFAFRYQPAGSKIIAITGSNGKSTTTKLTYHLLKEGGLNVAMGGNIGYSFARLLTQKPCDWYVLELSSFQLDDILNFRPDIAVMLNITPDHLDRYNYDFAQYVQSKFRITQNQHPQDLFIINADDPAITSYNAQHKTAARQILFTMKHPEILQQEAGAVAGNSEMTVRYEGEDMQLSRQDNPLQGKHNQYNSMAAGISARAAGIRQASIRESFKTFEGLEHRLEDLGYANGVHFINDSKATNMNSVWYALESMKAPVVLILGGHDKGNDYNEIADLVQEKVKAIVCLGVNNEPIISFFGHTISDIIETQSAATAVEAARSLSAPGDVVLLSPGCSSYDLFVDYQDRGNQFKAAVKQLKD